MGEQVRTCVHRRHAHFGLHSLLHIVVLGDLAHIGLDERLRLAHGELILINL